jgi:hypothetical protein
MVHLAIQEADETGRAVTWGEPVTDAGSFDGQIGPRYSAPSCLAAAGEKRAGRAPLLL